REAEFDHQAGDVDSDDGNSALLERHRESARAYPDLQDLLSLELIHEDREEARHRPRGQAAGFVVDGRDAIERQPAGHRVRAWRSDGKNVSGAPGHPSPIGSVASGTRYAFNPSRYARNAASPSGVIRRRTWKPPVVRTRPRRMYPASSRRFEWVSRLPSVRPRVSRAQVNAAARFRNRSAMIRRRVAWWITGSKEGSATRPPSLGSRGQIQSATKQDEPARQRGDQREPLAGQEDVSAEQEAADESHGRQEDASEDPEPPLGGIVAVQAEEAHRDHANALRHEHPCELGHGDLRDRDRRESGEDDPHDDGAREDAFPSLGGAPGYHEAHGAPQRGGRNQPDGGPRRPEDGEQDPEGVVSVPVTRETDQDAKQCIADEDRRRHDAPDHPGEAARTTGEGPVEPFDSPNLRNRGVRRESFAFVNVRVHGEGIRPGAQADIVSLRRRAFPGAFDGAVSTIRYAGLSERSPRNRTPTRERRKPSAVIPIPAKITK